MVVGQNGTAGAARHGLAVVVFGLLFGSGVSGLAAGAHALAVPMLVAGVCGAAGALVIGWSVWRRPGRVRAQDAARIGMAVAAAATVVVGVALAPAGSERGFVIAVNSVIGGLLAVFALVAGERAG